MSINVDKTLKVRKKTKDNVGIEEGQERGQLWALWLDGRKEKDPRKEEKRLGLLELTL